MPFVWQSHTLIVSKFIIAGVHACLVESGVSPLSEQACRVGVTSALFFNTLRPRQHGRHFPDDIFKCIFFNENVLISLKISLKFIPNNWINYIPVLVQIMAWRRPGDEPLSEPMMICLLTHICVTRPQWGNFLLMGLQNAHPGSF